MFKKIHDWYQHRKEKRQLPYSNLTKIAEHDEIISNIADRLNMLEKQSYLISKQLNELQPSPKKHEQIEFSTPLIQHLTQRLDALEEQLNQILNAREKEGVENKSDKKNFSYTELHDDQKLLKILSTYERLTTNEKFVPLDLIIQELMHQQLVSTETEANSLINRYAHAYPKSIRIEQVRGRSGRQIAIYINKLLQEKTR